MIVPGLIVDADLDAFPGGPYPPAVVRAAEASIRKDAGWHIAPVIRQTLTLDCTGSAVLVLPTLRVVTVYSVLTVDGLELIGWNYTADGLLWAPGLRGWAAVGPRVTVDFAHGFDNADDLLPVVAGRCQRQLADATLTQRSETQGSRSTSESYNSARLDPTSGLDAIAAYRLPVVA